MPSSPWGRKALLRFAPVDGSDWIALGALVVSGIALGIGIRANKHADRSATAAEHSAQAAIRANELMANANEIQATASVAAERRGLPVLIVRPVSNREADPKARTARVRMRVENAGGLCRDIVVITNWGEAPGEPPALASGHVGAAIARTEDWEEGTYPVPSAVRFKDDQGRQQELPLAETQPNIWTTP